MIETLEELRERQSQGGKKRWRGTTKKERRKIMREVVNRRWNKGTRKAVKRGA